MLFWGKNKRKENLSERNYMQNNLTKFEHKMVNLGLQKQTKNFINK